MTFALKRAMPAAVLLPLARQLYFYRDYYFRTSGENFDAGPDKVRY